MQLIEMMSESPLQNVLDEPGEGWERQTQWLIEQILSSCLASSVMRRDKSRVCER